MVTSMDSTTDNIVSSKPIGRTLRDRKLDYAEPRPASARLTKNPFSLEGADILTPNQPPTKYPRPKPLVMPPSKQKMPDP